MQGAVTADGMGNLLSGLAGTVPNTTYSTSIAVTELTGVGARSVGIAAGVIFVLLAFCPKALAAVLAIPNPVAAAYVTVLLAMLFVLGMKIVIQDGVDYRKGLIVGVSFWAGVGFQSGVIFPEIFAGFAGGILQNGMTAGGLVALLLTLFVEAAKPRPKRIEIAVLDVRPARLASIPDGFRLAQRLGRKNGRPPRYAGEETVLTLLEREEGRENETPRRLFLVARSEEGEAVLEFLAGTGDENLQDRIAVLGEQAAGPTAEQEFSLRLLRHVASSVRHQQYHDTDIVTVRVKAPA